MASPVVFFLILATIAIKTGHVCSQTSSPPEIRASQNPLPVGSNVTLFSTQHVTTGVWLFEGSVIMVIYPGGYMIIDNWMNRTTFNPTTSSLSIMSLNVQDSGVYSLTTENSISHITLSVQVPISNVTMTAKATNLVEFNDTAVLMCSVSTGTPLSYTWRNGSSAVTAGGDVQLSNGNATLTLVNVTRYDTGPFYCFVFNGVSNGSSSSVNLTISYGPSNPAMMVMPMTSSYSYRTGSNITLSCSADSSPSAIISWMLNNVSLNHTDPQFQLQNATRNNSGTYKCLFYNTVTLRFSSASEMIRILDPLTSVTVTHTGGPAIFNKPFNLTCVVTESVDTILWWKDGQLISASNTTIIGADNKTLELSPVRRSDNGSYWCQAFNAVSNRTSSPYNVIVDYGPDIPTITGPNVAKTGDSVTLTCYASSDPPSFYTWYFGGSLVANTSNYVTPPLTTNMSGVYTCMAYNNVTGQNTTANATLTVVDPIQNVQIAAPTNPAIAGYSYNLTCEVTGPADHVYWMMADMPLYADNAITYSTDNKTITFNPIRVSDTGRYQCMAMNAVGNRTSPDYMFVVNYGPQMPIITGPQFAESGQSAQFNCSAMSQPPSQYSWWFNNMTVANTSDLTIQNLSSTMSGKYTCMAYNNVTGNYSSNYTMLTVIQAITSVMIVNTTIPINLQNFTLTCKVDGTYDSIYWMKDNRTLAADPQMSYNTVNNTLQFNPLTLNNNGSYRCAAKNQAATHISLEYVLQVNYGPLSVTISGPNSAKLSDIVSLTCFAASWPNSYFQWFFNSQAMVQGNGSVMTFSVTTQSQGSYTCMAQNPVTKITMNQTKAFTVTAHASVIHFPSCGSLMLMGLLTVSAPVLFS